MVIHMNNSYSVDRRLKIQAPGVCVNKDILYKNGEMLEISEKREYGMLHTVFRYYNMELNLKKK